METAAPLSNHFIEAPDHLWFTGNNEHFELDPEGNLAGSVVLNPP